MQSSQRFNSEPFQSDLNSAPDMQDRQGFEAEIIKEPTRVGIQELPKKEKKIEKDSQERVEIVWMVPKEPVDAFILRYGYSRYNLDKEKRVESIELEIADDPQHGYVYKFLLKPIQTDRTLFVALATVSGSETSAFSDVFSVAPLDEQDMQ